MDNFQNRDPYFQMLFHLISVLSDHYFGDLDQIHDHIDQILRCFWADFDWKAPKRPECSNSWEKQLKREWFWSGLIYIFRMIWSEMMWNFKSILEEILRIWGLKPQFQGQKRIFFSSVPSPLWAVAKFVPILSTLLAFSIPSVWDTI